MIIVGIDPASKTVGVAVIDASVDQDKPIILERRSISAKQSKAEDRLVDIYWEITELFKKYQPDYVGIESQYMRRNPRTLKVLAFASGVIWASALANTNAEIHILEATQWRRYLLGEGKGSAKKEDVVKYLASKYDLSETDQKSDVDSLEALGIALAVLNLTKKVSE